MSTATSSDAVANTAVVLQNIHDTCIRLGRSPDSVKLIAVSKTKPVDMIQSLYDSGHRDFGENYFDELEEKAGQLPGDIRWHFIGHLQSSKANKLVKKVTNLHCIQSVDSAKLASKLNSARESVASMHSTPLQIMIQVSTSDEETKSGVSAEEASELAMFIREQCPLLALSGLMTIGAPGDMTCFQRLCDARKMVTSALGVEEESLELSMGMSGDYVEAIERGATVVRVGSTIFGPRIYPNKA
jgi:PLP dependent protein